MDFFFFGPDEADGVTKHARLRPVTRQLDLPVDYHLFSFRRTTGSKQAVQECSESTSLAGPAHANADQGEIGTSAHIPGVETDPNGGSRALINSRQMSSLATVREINEKRYEMHSCYEIDIDLWS